jgi:hypothetical protein
LRFAPSTLFQNFSEKSLRRNVVFFASSANHSRVWRGVLGEGSAEHENSIFLIKNFLGKKTNEFVYHYPAISYNSIFLIPGGIFLAATNANIGAPSCLKYVSKQQIQSDAPGSPRRSPGGRFFGLRHNPTGIPGTIIFCPAKTRLLSLKNFSLLTDFTGSSSRVFSCGDLSSRAFRPPERIQDL